MSTAASRSKVNFYVKTLRLIPALAAISALLSGCSGTPSTAIPKITSVNPLSTGTLQVAVGTANLYGTMTGLNLVSTYRQSGGLSNVLVDTPTITSPFTLPAASAAGGGIDAYSTLPGGPSVEEVAIGGELTGTSQSVHPGTPACDSLSPCSVPSASGPNVTIAPNTSTFGQAGGVFTDGISPGNSTNQGVATSYVPYTEPLFDTSSGNTFVPFAGPPAYGGPNGLGTRDGTFSLGAGVLGLPLGISTFAGVGIATGSYKLSLQVPTGFSGQTETYGTTSATATMSSTALLGGIAAPALTLDGNGGGSFVIASLPAGVTEELVEITNFGDGSDAPATCQGALGATIDTGSGGAGPVYYTIEVKSPGTYTLPDTIGPNTTFNSGPNVITPSESLCSAAANTAAEGATAPADVYTVQAIGADYPLYESLYPNTTSVSPTLVGVNGQADITISATTLVGTLSKSRRPAVHAHIRRT